MSYLYKSISCIDNAVWTLPPSSSGPFPRHTTQKKIKSQVGMHNFVPSHIGLEHTALTDRSGYMV
jgi:hypothetical protein